MTRVLSAQFRHLHSSNNYVEEHKKHNDAENKGLCEECVEMLIRRCTLFRFRTGFIGDNPQQNTSVELQRIIRTIS